MPELATLVNVVDERFLWVAAAAALAGIVRGFSGFGTAMVYVPVASALYEPKIAVVQLFIFDVVATLPLLVNALRQCTWREIVPLLAGAVIGVPIGVQLLLVVDPVVLRWFISLTILVILSVMASGWRYERTLSQPTTVAIGSLSGVSGGIAGLSGPPVILFWLGGQNKAPVVRANILAFFGLMSVITGLTFWANDLFTADIGRHSLLILPVYALGIGAGALLFRGADEKTFRSSLLQSARRLRWLRCRFGYERARLSEDRPAESKAWKATLTLTAFLPISGPAKALRGAPIAA